MSSGGYETPHMPATFSRYEPRRTSGPLPSSYERPPDAPAHHRSPSPSTSNRAYDGYVPTRSGIALRDDHPNAYRSNNYRPDYSASSFYSRSPSPDRYAPLPRTAELDLWERPATDWQPAYKSTNWQDRRPVPASPTTSVRSRGQRDEVVATRMFEPSESWKQNNSDRAPREDPPPYAPDRYPDLSARVTTEMSPGAGGYSRLGRTAFVPGGDRYRPTPPKRDAHPAVRSEYDSYRPSYDSKWGNRTPSFDREPSPVSSHRRDSSSTAIPRTWDHYEPSYADRRSSRYESRSRSPDWKPNESTSSSPRNSEFGNGRRHHGDSDILSAKKELSRRSSHSSIASTHVSDLPQAFTPVPSKLADSSRNPQSSGVQSDTSDPKPSSSVASSKPVIRNTVTPTLKPVTPTNSVVDVVPVPNAAHAKPEIPQASNVCDVASNAIKDPNISLPNRMKTQPTNVLDMNGGSLTPSTATANKGLIPKVQPTVPKSVNSHSPDSSKASLSNNIEKNSKLLTGSVVVSSNPPDLQPPKPSPTVGRPPIKAPAQSTNTTKELVDAKTVIPQTVKTQEPQATSSPQVASRTINGDIKSQRNVPAKTVKPKEPQVHPPSTIQTRSNHALPPAPINPVPAARSRQPNPSDAGKSSSTQNDVKTDEKVLLELPAQFTPELNFLEVPSLAKAKSFTEALRAIVMTRLINDHQTRDDIVNPVLLANKALVQAHPIPRTIESSTPGRFFDEVNQSQHSEKFVQAFNAVRPSLAEHFEQRQALVSEKIQRLSEEYLSLHEKWKAHCAALNEQQRTTLVSEIESIQHTGRTTRRTTAITDAVRSDLEMEQIIASLGNDDATDPNYLSARNRATIPDMISVTRGKVDFAFDDTNHFVEDPAEYYGPHTGIDDWTEDEKRIFVDKFAAFPKQFGIIADYLPNKTTAQCVDYYYLHKKRFIDFRKVVSQFAPNKRRRRGPGKKRGNGLLADIAQHDAEVGRDQAHSPSSFSIPSRVSKGRRGAATNALNIVTNATTNSNNNASAAASDTVSAAGTPQAEAKQPEVKKPTNPRKAMVQFEDTPTSTPTPEPDSRPRRKKTSGPAPQPTRVISYQSAMEEEEEEEALEPEQRPAKRAKRSRKQVKSVAIILDDGSPPPAPVSNANSTPASSASKAAHPKGASAASTETSNDRKKATANPTPLATTSSLSSHPNHSWSEGDKNVFLKLLAQYGDDFKRIAASMPNKTTVQVSNFFKNNAIELNLEVIAKKAPKRSPTPDAGPSATTGASRISASCTASGKANNASPSVLSSTAVNSSPPMASLMYDGNRSRPAIPAPTGTSASHPLSSAMPSFGLRDSTASVVDPQVFYGLRVGSDFQTFLQSNGLTASRLAEMANGYGGSPLPSQQAQPHTHPVTTMVQPYGMDSSSQTPTRYHPSALYDAASPPNASRVGVTPSTAASSSRGTISTWTRSPQMSWRSRNPFDSPSPGLHQTHPRRTTTGSLGQASTPQSGQTSQLGYQTQARYSTNHYPQYGSDLRTRISSHTSLYQSNDSHPPAIVVGPTAPNGSFAGGGTGGGNGDGSKSSGGRWSTVTPKGNRPYYYS